MSDDKITALAAQIERVRKQIIRARQVQPGAGSSERKAAASVVAYLQASLQDLTDELAKASAP
jgi:hypothetical protein